MSQQQCPKEILIITTFIKAQDKEKFSFFLLLIFFNEIVLKQSRLVRRFSKRSVTGVNKIQ